jgi:hypothetical protein
MEIIRSEIKFFIRASNKNINVDHLISSIGLKGENIQVWREGEPINQKKSYSNSGVIIQLYNGTLDDLKEGISNTVVPYLEKINQHLSHLGRK